MLVDEKCRLVKSSKTAHPNPAWTDWKTESTLSKRMTKQNRASAKQNKVRKKQDKYKKSVTVLKFDCGPNSLNFLSTVQYCLPKIIKRNNNGKIMQKQERPSQFSAVKQNDTHYYLFLINISLTMMIFLEPRFNKYGN